MIRYLTVAEVAMLYQLKPATVRWYAHRDEWRRSTDNRKPVLYRADDVEKTMNARMAEGPQDEAVNSDPTTPVLPGVSSAEMLEGAALASEVIRQAAWDHGALA